MISNTGKVVCKMDSKLITMMFYIYHLLVRTKFDDVGWMKTSW